MNKEIIWNLVNSFLAGGLVLFGGLASGALNWETVCASIFAAAMAAIVQFKNYWDTEKDEYCPTVKLFTFISP